MHREIDSSVDAGPHPFSAVRMTRDLQAKPVCLVDYCLHFLERERWCGNERTVRPELMYFCPDKIVGRVDLDPIDTVKVCFTHCGTRKPGAVDVFALRIAGVEPWDEIRVRVCSPV